MYNKTLQAYRILEDKTKIMLDLLPATNHALFEEIYIQQYKNPIISLFLGIFGLQTK